MSFARWVPCGLDATTRFRGCLGPFPHEFSFGAQISSLHEAASRPRFRFTFLAQVTICVKRRQDSANTGFGAKTPRRSCAAVSTP
jgi:hypothetical protein